MKDLPKRLLEWIHEQKVSHGPAAHSDPTKEVKCHYSIGLHNASHEILKNPTHYGLVEIKKSRECQVGLKTQILKLEEKLESANKLLISYKEIAQRR